MQGINPMSCDLITQLNGIAMLILLVLTWVRLSVSIIRRNMCCSECVMSLGNQLVCPDPRRSNGTPDQGMSPSDPYGVCGERTRAALPCMTIPLRCSTSSFLLPHGPSHPHTCPLVIPSYLPNPTTHSCNFVFHREHRQQGV